MNQKHFFTVWAMFYVVFGIALLFIPDQFMTLFGCPLDKHGELIGRVLGSALGGLFFLYYSLRSVPGDSAVIKAIIILSLLFNAVDAPIMAIATVRGVMNQLGWMPVIVNIIIAASSLHFLLKLSGQNNVK